MKNFFTKNYRIGLDLDEVLVDFLGGFDREFKCGIKVNHFNFSYQTQERLKTLPDSFWKDLKPKIDPSEINFLPTAYVSTRPFDEKVTMQWIENNGFPCVPLVHVESSKVETCKKLKLDFFVDDYILNFQELNAAGITTFLMDCSHNKQFDVGDLRIHSLNEVIGKIQCLNLQR